MSIHRALVLAAVALLATTAAHAASDPIPITQCGQTIPEKKTGYLTADLTCPTTGVAVRVGRHGKLNLNGFTVTGGQTGVACEPVECPSSGCFPLHGSKCEVYGGTIGAIEVGVVGNILKLHDLTVTDARYTVIGPQRIDLSNCHIASPDGNVISGKKIVAENSTFDGVMVNGADIRLKSSSITNAVYWGVVSDRVRLQDSSSVTGNSTNNPVYGNDHPVCGVDFLCADLMTGRRPRLDATSSCGTSVVFSGELGSPSWGVCTLD